MKTFEEWEKEQIEAIEKINLEMRQKNYLERELPQDIAKILDSLNLSEQFDRNSLTFDIYDNSKLFLPSVLKLDKHYEEIEEQIDLTYRFYYMLTDLASQYNLIDTNDMHYRWSLDLIDESKSLNFIRIAKSIFMALHYYHNAMNDIERIPNYLFGKSSYYFIVAQQLLLSDGFKTNSIVQNSKKTREKLFFSSKWITEVNELIVSDKKLKKLQSFEFYRKKAKFSRNTYHANALKRWYNYVKDEMCKY